MNLHSSRSDQGVLLVRKFHCLPSSTRMAVLYGLQASTMVDATARVLLAAVGIVQGAQVALPATPGILRGRLQQVLQTQPPTRTRCPLCGTAWCAWTAPAPCGSGPVGTACAARRAACA